MNAKSLTLAVFLLCVLAMQAQERTSDLNAFTTTKKPLDWNDPKWWEVMKPKTSSGVALGKSDFVVRGPLVDTFLVAPRSTGERSLGRKILDLPIVNLFVPGPMPRPTRQGKYFAWGERETPWSVLADRPIAGPQGALITVSR